MNTVVLVTIMATAFMTLGMVLLVVKLRRSQIRSVSKVLVPNRGTGSIDGQVYTWQRSPAAQNKNPSFELTLPMSHPGRFTLRRENGFDRLGKKLGLAAEISSYDETFDQSTYISSPHPLFCSQLLSRSSVRSAVRHLLDRGFTALKLGKKGLSAVWMPYRPKDRVITDAELPELALQLAELQKAAERTAPNEEDLAQQRSWQRRLTLLYGLGTLALILGIAALIIGLTAYPPLDVGQLFLYALKGAIPALLVFCWLCFTRLRGNPDAHGHMLGLTFLGLSAFLVLGFGGVCFLNGHLDRSLAVPHSALVVNKYFTKSKNNYTYHLDLSSWRSDQETEDQTVSRTFYDKMVPNESRLTITTRAGRFGFEWVESLRVESF
jgi:hypothetical protein